MRGRCRFSSKWSATVFCGALAAAISLAVIPSVARADGFFDFLFGGWHERPTPPARSNSYSGAAGRTGSLGTETVHEGGARSGHAIAFCVRLCDGESFPMEHFANATPIETCQALCPASKTQVFFGTVIDNAATRDGARYADLDNAYVYRKRLVARCTCNGRDAFGLAPLAVASDPTLRLGDIVVTQEGLMAYAGKRDQGATYTPINPSAVMTQLNSVTSPPRVQPGSGEPENPGIIVESENAPPQYLPPLVELRGQVAK